MYSVAFVLVLFQFILFVCYSYLVKYGVRDGRFSFFLYVCRNWTYSSISKTH